MKKMIQIVLMIILLGSLAACSHLHRSGSSLEGKDDSVQTSGVADDSFAENGETRADLLANKTYYFDFDKNIVHDSDKPAIFANANYLLAHPDVHVIIAGHTDPRGSREYNIALGERRANAVFDLLSSKGVPLEQMRVLSYGEEKLASMGYTEADYQLDRRVVIMVTRNKNES